jgi:CHAD domain-containing protein
MNKMLHLHEQIRSANPDAFKGLAFNVIIYSWCLGVCFDRILNSMSHTDELLSSFNVLWNRFSRSCKKTHAKVSPKSLHDLRVCTRRLIATVELIGELSDAPELARAQRRFKKVLKWTSPLRDVHVELDSLSDIRGVELRAFKRSLERREKQEVSGVQKELKPSGLRRLVRLVKDIRSELGRKHGKVDPGTIKQSVERIIRLRQNEFLRARRHLKPSDEDTLHEMRIALKKLRYSVEAAEPILGNAISERAKDMKTLQQLMGDTRDTAILRAELEEWATKKGRKKMIASALDQLERRRIRLEKRITKHLPAFDRMSVLPSQHRKPVTEKTRAVSVAPDVVPSPAYPVNAASPK